MRRSVARASLAAALLLALACGGGGGGSPTEPTPTPTPAPSVTFTPQSPGPSGILLATGAGSNATTLILEVRATSVSDLYGVAFDLTYPPGLLQHVRSTQGPLLAGGTFQGTASAGRLVIGLSNLGPVPGASGSGLLMTFEFRAAGAGEGTIAFSKNQAVDSQGQAIAGLTWSAGTVRVTQ
jgi:hypothetical protein